MKLDGIINLIARNKLVAVITTGLMLLVSALLYPDLPSEVSMHWNVSGEVDTTASKDIAVLTLPLITILLSALFEFAVSSKRELAVGSLCMILLVGLHTMLLLVNIGYNIPIVPITLFLVAILVAVSFWSAKEQ